MKRRKQTRAKKAPPATDAGKNIAPAPRRIALRPWQTGGLLFVLGALAVGYLFWSATADPRINFLPRHAGAEWIVFPKAMDAGLRHVASTTTIFRREFAVEKPPANARLAWRAAKNCTLQINGAPVELTASPNWKTKSEADVSGLLRAGRNEIAVRVANDNAPPALWLLLAGDETILRSDASWESSCAGSAWRPAALARAPRLPGPGNAMAGGEVVSAALGAVWFHWLILAALAAALSFVGCRCWSGKDGGFSRRQTTIVLLGVAASWLFLFLNNARLMPFLHGFDAQDHLNYIRYLQERHALPWPTEGFEMFQPPLYYLIAAAVLSLFGLTTDAPAAIMVLRLLTMFFGIAQFVLVFLSVRLFFPGRVAAPLVGLGLAAFLPMTLYLSHYVTNETLAAALVTAALYLALRLLRSNEPTTGQFAWLGLCLGAAMLTKATALLLVAPLFLVLTIFLAQAPWPLALRLRHGLILTAVFLLTCCWHYLRIWRRFGTPLVGNWDPASGFSWWQDPGFHVAGNYLRFGQSLAAPFFSGFWSFWDGIYSTFWGDALSAGVPNLAFRPPWNYNLMVAGYIPALVPTALIAIGAAFALVRFVRKPSLGWLLLFGLTSAVLFGLIAMTLKVASYAQVKAFYGLAALTPICLFAALGWEVVTRGRRGAQMILGAFLIFCALNCYAAFWVAPSAGQKVYASARLALDGKMDAAAKKGAEAVKRDPTDAAAERFLASVLNDAGRPNEALPHAQRALNIAPQDQASHLQLALVLDRLGQADAALNETRRALELGPENLPAANFLVASLAKQGRGDDAIRTAREALAVHPYSFELHHALGMALAQKQDFPEAAREFAQAFLLQPKLAQTRANLQLALRFLAQRPDPAAQFRTLETTAPPRILAEMAWFLSTQPDATLRNGPEALRLAERAAAATKGSTDPSILVALAVSLAESGDFARALRVIEEARIRAEKLDDKELVRLCGQLLAECRAGRAHREGPAPSGPH